MASDAESKRMQALATMYAMQHLQMMLSHSVSTLELGVRISSELS